MVKRIVGIPLLLVLVAVGVSVSFVLKASPKIDNYLVYYAEKADFNELAKYNLLVFDSDKHPPLRPLQDRGKILLGYISLGEAENHRRHFKAVKAQGILGEENQYWKGSYYVDQRDPRWAKRVIEDLIPKILQKGFDGIFMDTLDNPAHMERTWPDKYGGMIQAGVNLVKAIRHHYPDIKIMMNRGYELLPQVAGDIDFEMAESLYADYNFETKTYRNTPHEDYQYQIRLLNKVKKMHPHLQIVSLDYWNPEDAQGIMKIYEIERQNGFVPYVATVELNRIVLEPASSSSPGK